MERSTRRAAGRGPASRAFGDNSSGARWDTDSATGRKIQRALAPAIADAGLQLARDRQDATYLLPVTFTPDPVNPDGGHLAMERIVPVRRAYAANQDEIARMKRLQDDQLRAMDRFGTSSP